MKYYFIGIDVSKEKLDATLMANSYFEVLGEKATHKKTNWSELINLHPQMNEESFFALPLTTSKYD